ncbi:MAG TPA: hypothetical protein VFI46_15195 [Jiangellaceae bacterium]|nr:hypothetical protein [Jiangellaceae bacterium]
MVDREAAAWLSVRVELIGGRTAGELWPRPGRVFVVSSLDTFHDFAEAIDDAFARWDRSHLHEFRLPKPGKSVTEFSYIDDVDPAKELDAESVRLGDVLEPGDEFEYIFDLGDMWRHRCVVDDTEVDAVDMLGRLPLRPFMTWGWGLIPDPYGRFFEDETADPESRIPGPPDEWPWGNAGDAEAMTLHLPGTYTLTIDRRPRDPEDE